jgi:CspA family cold shock protein
VSIRARIAARPRFPYHVHKILTFRLLFDTVLPTHTTTIGRGRRTLFDASKCETPRPPARLAGQNGHISGDRRSPMTGEIKRVDRSRGFGFIRPDGASEDVFFHTSALQGLVFDELNEGQKVEFEKQPDDRDPRRSRAVNVRAAG